MADVARPMRRSPAASDFSKLKSRVFLVFDLLALLAVLATAAALFWYYSEAGERLYTGLGYGWIPVLAWAAGALLALRYRPGWVGRFWNFWLAGLGVVVLTVGILSFFDAARGPLAFVGLGGRWAETAMGESAVIGIAKLVLVALAIPLLALYEVGILLAWLAGRARQKARNEMASLPEGQ